MKALTDEENQTFPEAFAGQRPNLLSRVRAAGRTWEDAEDFVQDLYAEIWRRLPVLSAIRSWPAWIQALATRRLTDLWRSDRVRKRHEADDAAAQLWVEVAEATGLDPLDSWVREEMADALDDALAALPKKQRQVVEAQVFGGKSFRELALETGESIDTLMARKRYAVQSLGRALRHWIDD